MLLVSQEVGSPENCQMSRVLLFVLHALTLFAAVAGVPALAADKRVALVIGNSGYTHAADLGNPRNDAADIAAVLENNGFTVVIGLDLDKAAMNKTIRRFADALVGAEVGVFFYAGHGLQVGGQNYLVPIDAKLDDASGLDFELVRLDVVQRVMEGQAGTNILFLDACRNNPLTRNLARAMGTRAVGIGRGLAAIESGVGTLISFSTQPGNVALDGEGRNSPFTGALVKHIQTIGEDLSSILIKVRNDVMVATKEQQVPWEHTALRAKLYFTMLDPAAADPAVIPLGHLGPFDGRWEVSLNNNAFCPRKTFSFNVMINNSKILAHQPEPGRVDAEGSFSFSTYGFASPANILKYSGRVKGEAGQGSYLVIGQKCAGTLSLKRLNSAPPEKAQ